MLRFVLELGTHETADDLEKRLERAEVLDASPMEAMRLMDEQRRRETPWRSQLELLAIAHIYREFNCSPREVRLVAELKELGEIEDVSSEDREYPIPHSVSPDQALLEVQKRRVLNSLMQGAAHKTQNMFFLDTEKLAEYDPALPDLCKRTMALGDQMYFTLPQELRDQFESSQQFLAGLVTLDFNSRPTTVQAQAISYPILLHELGKGVMEVLALHGLPTDEKLRNYVKSVADTRRDEAWDLRVGPAIWERFIQMFSAKESDLRNEVFKAWASLPPEEFLSTFRELVSADGKAAKLLALKEQLKEEANSDPL